MTQRILFLPVLMLILVSCTRSKDTVFSGSVLGSSYEVRFGNPAATLPAAQIEKTVAETCRSLEAVFNDQDKDSEISRFNKSERLIWTPVSRAMVNVVSVALEIAKLTDGAWDPTGGKLTEIYRKTGGKDPGPNTLASAQGKVGYHYLEARQDPLALKKTRHGLIVDVRNLAQAYAVDEIAEALKRQGLGNFKVKIGQVMRATGVNAAGETWPFSFQKPVNGAQTALHLTNEVVPLDNRSAATVSAPDSKNPISPMIDPRSGKPLVTDLLNVSVVDLSALKALAMASGLFSVGRSEAMILAKRQAVSAFFVALSEEKGIAEATPLFPQPIKTTY